MELSDYFIFNQGNLKDQFKQNIELLQGPGIISLSTLANWDTKSLQVIAQTIDGDYLIQVGTKTKVVPYDLHLNGIETYDEDSEQFLQDYQAGKIQSKILPKW